MVWRRKSRVWYSTLSPGTVRYGTVWYHDEGTSFVAKQETFRDSMNSISVSRAEVNTRPLTPPPPSRRLSPPLGYRTESVGAIGRCDRYCLVS